jgi:MFS family permease
MAEVKCKKCGHLSYSKKSVSETHVAICTECGEENVVLKKELKKKEDETNLLAIIGVIIIAALIAGLAFGSIALTYFSRKKGWHWISYLGSVIVAVFCLYYTWYWDDDWFGLSIFLLNFIGILYASFILFRKWVKWYIAVGLTFIVLMITIAIFERLP